ncbi:hypothetical protein KUTeg_003753 [Tegillarca granosa]|uniref:Multiple inositol polyphosphate phosphatase 1 n=1 Tax=Tegillarca granosa TaxID=220873 RepID=A0ABQ9FPV0_TEGGR|nr:hypothetical protein KUTeg_003753 [Tegillarca granosa]
MASTPFLFVFSLSILIFPCVFSSDDVNDVKSLVKPVFSTKTPYFWVNDENEEIEEDEETVVDFEGKSCQVIFISTLLRHGARYSGLKWMKKITDVRELLIKTLDPSSEIYPFLEKWANPFQEKEEKQLSELGEDEQYELGKRFGERFKLLFSNDIENVKFVSSSKQRTKASAVEFHEGLIDSVGGDETPVNLIIDDIKLRFHDNCNKYTTTVDKNVSTLVEYKKFKNGPEMANVAKEISKKLGIDKVLTADEINSIFQQCAFEVQLLNTSDWCHLLNEDHFRVIEYLNDLKQYWKKAYGHNITAKMSCPLVRHMFKEVDKAIHMSDEGDDHTVGVFHFGHAETIAPLYAALELFNDSQPLKANNFEFHKDRLFKSSKIMPFSANFAMAVYECDEDPDNNDENDLYVIKFFVNEKQVIIPACDSFVCPYKSVRDYYSDKIDKCHFEDLCSTEKPAAHDEL